MIQPLTGVDTILLTGMITLLTGTIASIGNPLG